jgi:hypothetical protein
MARVSAKFTILAELNSSALLHGRRLRGLWSSSSLPDDIVFASSLPSLLEGFTMTARCSTISFKGGGGIGMHGNLVVHVGKNLSQKYGSSRLNSVRE